MALDLSNKHPEWTETATARTKGRDLYSGTAVVRAKRTTYLIQETNESDADYENRLRRAVLDPYCEKIIAARQGMLFRKEATRILPAGLAKYENNVDLKGTPGGVFFRDAASEAQVDGAHWVLVDMPRAPEGGYGSQAEAETYGARPYFDHVPAGAVVDWSVGEDRELSWAVIAYQHTNEGERGWGYEIESESRWKVWTREAWYIYGEAANIGASAPGTSDKFILIDEGVNPTGVVPLVPFLGLRLSDYAGWPVCHAVLDHIVLLYNKASDLDWYERLSAHPIPYVIGPEKPEILDVAKGLYLKSEPSGGAVSAGYLEPAGTAYDALRASMDSLVARILSIALAQSMKDSAQVQSAEGQREDRKIFAASLETTSQAYEAAEQRCWDVAAAWTKDTSAVDITYSRDFDDSLIEATMLNALTGLVAADMLTRTTALEIMQRGDLLPEGIDIAGEIESLESADALAVARLAPRTDRTQSTE